MTVTSITVHSEAYPVPHPENGFDATYSALSGLADSAGHDAVLPMARRQPTVVLDSEDVRTATHERDRVVGEPKSDGNGGAEASADANWKAICSRLLAVSDHSVSDADLLALLLSYLGSSGNSRALASKLIDRFGSFGSVVTAQCAQIADTAEIEPTATEFFALVRAAGTRLAREEICSRPVFDAWDKLIAYLRTTMAHQTVEQIRILFLDRRNVLIADEVQHTGTIDHTPVYPREVAKRALTLDASSIIMVHNHPSNHPAPSKADIAMTRTIQDTMNRLGVVLHDHIIVSRRGHSSFRDLGLLRSQAA